MANRTVNTAHKTTNGAGTVTRTCRHCGAPARLFGIEPHPIEERVELQTYVCTRCEGLETESVPLPSAPAA
jgi:hypothetical protein